MDPIGIQSRNDAQTMGAGRDGTTDFASYFGPTNGDIRTNPYDKFGYTNFDLPDAYKGRNMFLRDTIDGFIMEDNTWFTTVCLPYVRTDEHHFVWNEWHFDTHLVGRVPEEGISRLIRSSKRSFKESTVRRGIAFQLEHGFMNTAEGRQQYVMNLNQIKQSVQETANHDVIAAILNARRYDKEWEKKHGVLQKPFTVLNRREVSQWAVAQKHPNGLDILHEEFKQRLARWNVKPNMWIFPPKLCLYLTMVPPEKTEFGIAGPSGPAKLEAGPAALTTFRGVQVYETRLFDVYEGDLPIDLLRRNQTIGEYNVMDDPFHHSTLDKYGKYNTNMRDIVVYNEDDDQWARISFIEALKSVVDRDLPDVAPINGRDCMYAFDQDTGEQKKCSIFIQMEKEFLSMDTVKKVVRTMKGNKNVAAVQSLVRDYDWTGPESVPMFQRTASRDAGLRPASLVSKVTKMGLDPSFVSDVHDRLQSGDAQQRFLHGLQEYIDGTEAKNVKNLYKTMQKKAPKTDPELQDWLQNSPMWQANLDHSTGSSGDAWVRTTSTWEPRFENDPNWMPGDPATNYTTAAKVRYTPSTQWNDTPWVVSARQGTGHQPAKRLPVTSSSMFSKKYTGSDIDDILGAGSSAKIARVGNDIHDFRNNGVEWNAVGETLGVGTWQRTLWDEVENWKDEEDKQNARTFLTASLDMKNLVVMAQNNMLVPFNILLMRPEMEYEMCSAVLMKGGTETGMTAVGHNDFQLGDDVAAKMHYGHYTFKSKAFVQQPRNLIIAENVFAQGYNGGNGVRFHDGKKAKGGSRRNSIHAWLTSYEQTHFPSPIDLSGRFHDEGNTDEEHIQGCEVHRIKWHRHARNNKTCEEDEFLASDERVNTVCYQGHQFSYDTESGKHTVVTRNTGHWGPNVYPGCGVVRAGEAAGLRDMHYVTTAR